MRTLGDENALAVCGGVLPRGETNSNNRNKPKYLCMKRSSGLTNLRHPIKMTQIELVIKLVRRAWIVKGGDHTAERYFTERKCSQECDSGDSFGGISEATVQRDRLSPKVNCGNLQPLCQLYSLRISNSFCMNDDIRRGHAINSTSLRWDQMHSRLETL